MENERIQSFMENLGGDLVKWISNPPATSHMGGSWEKQIDLPVQYCHPLSEHMENNLSKNLYWH